MKERVRTMPNLAEHSEEHCKAIAAGSDHFSMWSRNVIDRFKDKTEDEIKQTLQAEAFPFAVACENFIGDFNISTVIRNANAFNAEAVYYIGDKKFDRRGMLGCYKYMNINFMPSIEEFIALSKKYTFVGLDNVPGAIPLEAHTWEPNTMMIFGSEGVGLTPAMQSYCSKLVYIKQFGSIRSLNVGVASGIIMNDFVSKFTVS